MNRFTGRAEPVVVSKQFALPNALLLDEDGRIFISEKQYDPLGLGNKTGCLMVYDPEKEKVHSTRPSTCLIHCALTLNRAPRSKVRKAS